MRSCLYEGSIEHRRTRPREHHFRYPLYLYCLDLDELGDLDRNLPFFGYNRFRPAAIYDRDYLQETEGTIREKLLDTLRGKRYAKDIERTLLITSARYFRYVFNPVSFHYCLSPENTLLCIVAEVNNTFGEKHLYVLDEPQDPVPGYAAHYLHEKAFFVSPFNSTAGCYEFFFSEPGKTLGIRIDLQRDGENVFSAQLRAEARPLTRTGHTAMLLKHPFVPHLSMPRILFEAGRLALQKKLTYLDKPIPFSAMTIRRRPPGWIQRTSMRLVTGFFSKIRQGGIRMFLPDRQISHFGQKDSGLEGEITVNDYRFFSRLVLGGDVGLGEAYVDEDWDTADLVTLFRLFIRNREALADGYPATSWLKRRKNDLLHMTRLNTLLGARRNIRRHYDLSNDFFRLFLDRSMAYSCGFYRTETDTLENAQENKFERILQLARIDTSDKVLEIGCGWGGFAVAAARRTGSQVTGITLSEAQHRFALQRVQEENLQDRISILLQDYRKTDGTYDRIVSIEMLEAVGERYFGTFFRCCDRLLKPGGLLVLQVITIPDQRYDTYRKETDWIQKHIFPGGLLPSLTRLCTAATAHSSLVMESMEDIGPHYARTLHDWRDRFVQHRDDVAAMGFDRGFQRKWVYYLAICEAGFAERALGDIQVVFRKPSCSA